MKFDELELNHTKIDRLPDSMKNLIALKRLNLGNTGLTGLPEWIGNLPELEWMGLSDTKTKLPGGFSIIRK